MLLTQVSLSEKEEKPRSNKTLWFNDYTSWVHDIKLRFPDAEAYKADDNIIALDSSKEISYGIWKQKQQLGIAYFSPRPIHTAIHPRTILNKMDM